MLSALAWPGAGQVYLGRRGLGWGLGIVTGGALAYLGVIIWQAATAVVPTNPEEVAALDLGLVMTLVSAVKARVAERAWWLQGVIVGCWIVGVIDAWRFVDQADGGTRTSSH